jgi:hypothetical protein
MDANRWGTILAWAWLVVVMAYLGWGMASDAGLYRWLVDRQVARFGQYYPTLTALLPALLLGAPALAWLRRRHLAAEARDAAAGPAAAAARARRGSRVLALVGLVALAIGGGAFWWAQSLPAEEAPAVPFDAATLGTEPAPSGRVRIRGEVDPDAGAGIEESGQYRDTTEYYFGFRAEGEPAKDAPFRIFVARTLQGADAQTAQGFLPEQEGRLERNGLPELARRDLAARGVRIAEPHYVLRTGHRDPRETFYIVGGLGVLTGAAFLVVGLFQLGRRKSGFDMGI